MKNKPISDKTRKEFVEQIAETNRVLNDGDISSEAEGEEWFYVRLMERVRDVLEDALTWNPPDE